MPPDDFPSSLSELGESAAAEESAKTVQEQSQALGECEKAAQSLSELAEDVASLFAERAAEKSLGWEKLSASAMN